MSFLYCLFLAQLCLAQISLASASEKKSSVDTEALKIIHADYQVKASFFALPITAKISVEKLEPEIYQARIKLSSPFFKTDQKETARIKQCNVQLLEISSDGSRMGSDDWRERILIEWPSQLVSYKDGDKPEHRYKASFTPTGFTSLFAHQFVSLAQAQDKKALTYTQSSRGWRMDYLSKGRAAAIKNKFYKHPVEADLLIIPRGDLKEEDMPSVWYRPEDLGAFPLKMAMKLGVFTIETNLKNVDAKSEQIQSFFSEWGCSVEN